MNVIAPRVNFEAVWLTYLKAAICLVPAGAVWFLASTAVFPRLQLIWKESGSIGSSAQWIMDSTDLVMTSGGLLVATMLVAIALAAFSGRHAVTISSDPLGLSDLLQKFVDDRWLPAHATPDQRAAVVLMEFKQRVLRGIEC